MRNLNKGAKVVIRYTGRNSGKEAWETIRDVWNEEGMLNGIERNTPPYGVQFGVPKNIVFPNTSKRLSLQCQVSDHIANEEYFYEKHVALSYA